MLADNDAILARASSGSIKIMRAPVEDAEKNLEVLLILVSFQVETNYPGPCRQASQRLGVCRHLRQASFQLTHNPFH